MRVSNEYVVSRVQGKNLIALDVHRCTFEGQSPLRVYTCKNGIFSSVNFYLQINDTIYCCNRPSPRSFLYHAKKQFVLKLCCTRQRQRRQAKAQVQGIDCHAINQLVNAVISRPISFFFSQFFDFLIFLFISRKIEGGVMILKGILLYVYASRTERSRSRYLISDGSQPGRSPVQDILEIVEIVFYNKKNKNKTFPIQNSICSQIPASVFYKIVLIKKCILDRVLSVTI